MAPRQSEKSARLDRRDRVERDLKQLIVSSLHLKDIEPGQIHSETMLFGAGLGLDSVDALQLVVAIKQRYGVTLQGDEMTQTRVLASVRSLASYLLESERDAG